MAANWGVIEERDDDGVFIAYHVMPMVNIDGEDVPSAAHIMSDACPCHPSFSQGNGGWDIWTHHDPDHPGSEERAAQGEFRAVFNLN
jgi:hypothetical protein